MKAAKALTFPQVSMKVLFDPHPANPPMSQPRTSSTFLPDSLLLYVSEIGFFPSRVLEIDQARVLLSGC